MGRLVNPWPSRLLTFTATELPSSIITGEHLPNKASRGNRNKGSHISFMSAQQEPKIARGADRDSFDFPGQRQSVVKWSRAHCFSAGVVISVLLDVSLHDADADTRDPIACKTKVSNSNLLETILKDSAEA